MRARRVGPTEVPRPREATRRQRAPQIAVSCDTIERVSQGVQVAHRHNQRGVARHLWQRPASLQITGVPLAIASTTGMPKPS